MTAREILELKAAARQELEHRKIVARCREWVISHQRGPMFWLRNLTATVNFHWQEQGRQPVEPFPYMPYPAEYWTQDKLDALQGYFTHDFTLEDLPDYLDIVMGFLLTQKRINIPKSRELMTSWSVMGYICWRCQFYESVEAIGQSEKDEKAQGLVKYANILFDNQPEWLKQRCQLKRGTAGTQHQIEWANLSRFVAVPQGERQVASFHPTIYFNDESAHQPTYLATLSVVAPVARQIICVSSAAPGDFGTECEMSTDAREGRRSLQLSEDALPTGA